MIEWDGEDIRVRSSSTDAALANAIAVAGLHEIEELVVEAKRLGIELAEVLSSISAQWQNLGGDKQTRAQALADKPMDGGSKEQ